MIIVRLDYALTYFSIDSIQLNAHYNLFMVIPLYL